MSHQDKPTVCAISYTHHCYESDLNLASVWALPGVEDAHSNDAPMEEEYPNFPGAVALAVKVPCSIAYQLAKATVQLLTQLGIQSKLFVGADD
jgi:hypothetical protein